MRLHTIYGCLALRRNCFTFYSPTRSDLSKISHGNWSRASEVNWQSIRFLEIQMKHVDATIARCNVFIGPNFSRVLEFWELTSTNEEKAPLNQFWAFLFPINLPFDSVCYSLNFTNK